MPRIYPRADIYADEDFRKEILRRLADFGLRYDQDLSELSGIPNATMSRKLKNPSGFTVRQLRLIVRAVCPNPKEMLKFLGYTNKEINRWMNDQERGVALWHPPN